MPAIKYVVTLTDEERQLLQNISKKGTHRSRKVVDALILLNCDKNHAGQHKSEEDIAGLSPSGKIKSRTAKKTLCGKGT